MLLDSNKNSNNNVDDAAETITVMDKRSIVYH